MEGIEPARESAAPLYRLTHGLREATAAGLLQAPATPHAAWESPSDRVKSTPFRRLPSHGESLSDRNSRRQSDRVGQARLARAEVLPCPRRRPRRRLHAGGDEGHRGRHQEQPALPHRREGRARVRRGARHGVPVQRRNGLHLHGQGDVRAADPVRAICWKARWSTSFPTPRCR